MKDDQYGSVLRESLKKSMAEPAKQTYQSLNRRQVEEVHAGVLIVLFVVVIGMCVGSVYILDKWESHFRAQKVVVR